MKTITVFNKKGGTGKTSIAFNIAKDLNLPLLSNDDSVIEDIYPNKAKIIPDIKLIEHDCVYDLGGYIDSHIIDIIKNSSTIIIPTTLDINSIKRTINTTIEIDKYCSNIIIIINRVKANIKKYNQSINALKQLNKKIIYFRESEAINNSIHLGISIIELYNQSNLSKIQYNAIYNDYVNLLNILKD